MSPYTQPTIIDTTDNDPHGAVLAVVVEDGSVDVYQIPPHSVITIQPQSGFGFVQQPAEGVSKADAETAIDEVLTANQAV